jgi:hypothetical protein
MSLGDGNYDDIASALREGTRATGVIVVVIDGMRGSGFAVQLSLAETDRLPGILRELADEIDRGRLEREGMLPPRRDS